MNNPNLLELGFLTEMVEISGEYKLNSIMANHNHLNVHLPFHAISVYYCGEQHLANCIGTNSHGQAIMESGQILDNYIIVPKAVDLALSTKMNNSGDFFLNRSWYNNDMSCRVIHKWKLPAIHILKSDVKVNAYVFKKSISVWVMLQSNLEPDKIIGIDHNGLPILDSAKSTEYIVNFDNINNSIPELMHKLGINGKFFDCYID